MLYFAFYCDLSQWGINTFTDMSNMLNDCRSNWNVINVKDMSFMFLVILVNGILVMLQI